MGRRYAAPTPFERIVPNSLKANKRRNCHSISIYKVTGCASPADASGFLLVSLSKMPRPVTILPAQNAIRLGRAISDQGWRLHSQIVSSHHDSPSRSFMNARTGIGAASAAKCGETGVLHFLVSSN